MVYKAGASVNKIGYPHSSGTLYYGNGSSGYLRGSSVTVNLRGSPYGTLYYKSSSGSYLPVEDAYRDGGSATYYQGNGGYVTGRGGAVDAIEYNGTLYEKGSSVTQIGEEVSGAYQRNAEDDQTFTAVGSECSLNLATFTTREITALTT